MQHNILNTQLFPQIDQKSFAPLLFCSDEELTLETSAQLKSSRCLTYPHQLSVHTIHCFTRYADADQH